MTNTEAWNYAVGMIRVDGLEPTEDFKQYIEKEKRGEVTMDDVKKFLDKKYMMKPLTAKEIMVELAESRRCYENGQGEDFESALKDIEEKYNL